MAAAPAPDFRQTRFLTSAARWTQLPAADGAEVAFLGRSNSGKSSAINAICGQKSLARTGRTPGQTQLINLFAISPGRHLVDLPGYGYAAVPEAVRRGWQRAVAAYLQRRRALCGLALTMDIRTPLRDSDRRVLDWTTAAGVPVLALLTKADKLGVQARGETAAAVRLALTEFGAEFTVLPFSAKSGLGTDEARAALAGFLAAGAAGPAMTEAPATATVTE